MLRFLTGGWHLDLDSDRVSGLWYTHDPNFWSLSWFLRCQQHPCPKVLIWGFWGCFRLLTGIWHLDLDLNMVTGLWYTHDPIFFSILILKVKRTSMHFKASFGALEGAGGSWLGFGILIMIWICSLVFGTPMFQILALYLDFESAKNLHIL